MFRVHAFLLQYFFSNNQLHKNNMLSSKKLNIPNDIPKNTYGFQGNWLLELF